MTEITETHITAGLILIGSILGIIFIPWIVGRQIMKWLLGFYQEDSAGNYFAGLFSLLAGTSLLLGLYSAYMAIYTAINN
jgi:hypothetical protein